MNLTLALLLGSLIPAVGADDCRLLGEVDPMTGEDLRYTEVMHAFAGYRIRFYKPNPGGMNVGIRAMVRPRSGEPAVGVKFQFVNGDVISVPATRAVPPVRGVREIGDARIPTDTYTFTVHLSQLNIAAVMLSDGVQRFRIDLPDDKADFVIKEKDYKHIVDTLTCAVDAFVRESRIPK